MKTFLSICLISVFLIIGFNLNTNSDIVPENFVGNWFNCESEGCMLVIRYNNNEYDIVYGLDGYYYDGKFENGVLKTSKFEEENDPNSLLETFDIVYVKMGDSGKEELHWKGLISTKVE